MKGAALILVSILHTSFSYSQINDSTRSNKKIAPWFVERLKISVGFLYVVNNTKINVGIDGKPGSDINGERDFGINEETGTFVANFQWRISSRSRFTLSYFNSKRSATHLLDKDITFEDTTYPVNAQVSTHFNFSIIQFSYGYAILSKPRYELGLLIGAHIIGANTGIGTSKDNQGIATNRDFGFTAPLPDLGIWGGFAFTKRLALNFAVDYFTLTAGNFSGRVFASNATFIFRLVGQLDLTLGYSGINFSVDVTKQDANGRFKLDYNGPLFGVNFSFGRKKWQH